MEQSVHYGDREQSKPDMDLNLLDGPRWPRSHEDQNLLLVNQTDRRTIKI